MPDLHNYEVALSNDVVAGSTGSISVTLGANTRMYVNSDAGTTWVAVSSA